MHLQKKYLLMVSLAALLAAMAGWSWLPQHTRAAAITPTPAPTAASDEMSFTPSPDGRWTAVVNATAGSLDLQYPDSQTINIFPPGSTVNAVTWSPDSRHLLVVRTHWVFNQPEGTGVSSSGPITIWQVEIKDNVVQPARQLFQSPHPAGQDVAEQIQFGHWSPSSRHVLFWLGPLGASITADGLPLWVLDVTTGQATQVAEVALLNPRYQSWAPDSSALAITAGGYRSAQVNKWLALFDSVTGQVTEVISQTEQIPGIVAWSPTGDQIAYAAVPADQTGEAWADLMTFDNPAIAARRIYILDPTTGQSRRLNQADTFQDAPLWSDDGASLYYVQHEANKLVLMAADPTTGRAEAVPNAAVSLPEVVGYYGQAEFDSLLAQRPGSESAGSPTSQATATPPSPAEMEMVRFIFKNHPPELGTLTKEFLQRVEAGEYDDFTTQEVELTGEGNPEILVSGRADTFHLFVAILARNSAGALRELFYTANNNGKYVGQVRALMKEQQVIADFLTATGGTGYLEMTWEQRWIECQADQCELVWSAPLIKADRAVTWTTERNYAVAEIEQPDSETIRLTTRRFGLIIPALLDFEGGESAPPETTRRIIGPDTVETYQRSGPGGIYQLASRAQLGPGQEIAREFNLQTEETNNLVFDSLSQAFTQTDGTFDSEALYQAQAKLWGLPAPGQPDDPTWGSATRQPDIAAHTGLPGQLGAWVAGVISALDSPQCRLTVLGHTSGQFQPIGQVDLLCTAHVTHLAWVDVTGDNNDELLLLTIPPEVELAGQVQRLYVYSLTENNLTELATLDGVINGADGAGVRWQETAEGFQVQAGLPLLDPDSSPGFNEIRLDREFQTYVWDEGSKEFKLAE